MRKFLFRFLLFLVPLVLLAALFEVLLRNIPNDYRYKKNYLDKHASTIEVLITGSSHLYFGLDPEFFTLRAFNAGHVGQSLNYDYEIFKKYQDKFSDLKYVIVDISYFSFFSDIETEAEAWRVKNYNIYYKTDKSYPLRDHFELTAIKFSINLQRLFNYYILGKKEMNSSTLGWGQDYHANQSLDLTETGKRAAARHSREDIHSKQDQELYQQNLSIIEAIIHKCRQLGAKVLFLTPPAYHTYRDNVNKEQLEETISTIKEISSNCENCEYLDLFDDPRFVSADYYDGDHLNDVGAKKLSLIVNDYIEKH